MKKIDVVIPAYKAQATIGRTLGSIITQSIVDEIKVTIVNDCDGIGYKDIIKRFSPFVEIEEITLEQNGGPGIARQIGLERTELPYITFIDADDTYSGPFSLEVMKSKLERDESIVCSVGSFIEQRSENGLNFLTHSNDMIWMFGKLYKRSFLTKYNVHFNDTRSNEDTGFNTIVKLCADEKEQILFYSDVVYVWWFKADSITRVNNYEYSYNQSFIGYTANMIYAIKHARLAKPFSTKTTQWAIEVMANLFTYFVKTKFRDNRFIEQNFKACQLYYNEIFKKIEDEIPEEHMRLMIAKVVAEQGSQFLDFIPDITFYDFMEELRNPDKKGEENNE